MYFTVGNLKTVSGSSFAVVVRAQQPPVAISKPSAECPRIIGVFVNFFLCDLVDVQPIPGAAAALTVYTYSVYITAKLTRSASRRKFRFLDNVKIVERINHCFRPGGNEPTPASSSGFTQFPYQLYAHGSAAFGVRTPVSRYCSHKNHLPSEPR